METELIKPDYLFEVSWEVCNKVGGIYTVIATKSLYLKSEYNRHHIMVGPDVWMDEVSNPDFIEDPSLYRAWREQAAAEGIRVRIGRWNVPGKPTATQKLLRYHRLYRKSTGQKDDLGRDYQAEDLHASARSHHRQPGG